MTCNLLEHSHVGYLWSAESTGLSTKISLGLDLFCLHLYRARINFNNPSRYPIRSDTYQLHRKSYPSPKMGQKLSALKRRRVNDEDASFPTSLKPMFRYSRQPRDEFAVSLSSKIDYARSNLVETSSEVLQLNRESGSESAVITFLKIPTELILDIAKYLPPSTFMSLSYSCRTIRNRMNASIAHVLGDKVAFSRGSSSTPSIEVRNTRFLERLELRLMLDRDGINSSSTAFCVGCNDTHDCSLFSIASLAQPDSKRRCLGSAGLVWACPHRTIGYDKASRNTGDLDLHTCAGMIFVDGGAGCGWFTNRDGCITLWRIMRVPLDCVPSNEEVKEALGPLNAPICPHLRLNDAVVANAYSQECRKLRGGLALDCQCSVCLASSSAGAFCEYCNIWIYFSIKSESYGLETLRIYIRRSFEEMSSCTDRAWIFHVSDPADFEEYEMAWQASNAECLQKVQPIIDPLLGYMV